MRILLGAATVQCAAREVPAMSVPQLEQVNVRRMRWRYTSAYLSRAEAMGLKYNHDAYGCFIYLYDGRNTERYDPLYNDAQVFALVKKLMITLSVQPDGIWGVFHGHYESWTQNADINRAIVESVALMQKAISGASA